MLKEIGKWSFDFCIEVGRAELERGLTHSDQFYLHAHHLTYEPGHRSS